MKKTGLRSLVAAAVVLASTTAFAYSDTDYFTIGTLAASSSSANGYRVYPAPGYSLPTSEGCTKSEFAEIQTGLYSDEKDMINRTLLAAFLAHKNVKLRLDGCGISGRPAFRIVTLNAAQ